MNRSWSDVDTADEAAAAWNSTERCKLIEQDEAFCASMERAIAAGHELPRRWKLKP